MNLVIVESPSKTKTIKQFLGNDFDVVATKGHIRDIKDCGQDNLGLDMENGLKPIYEVIPKQSYTIKMLNEHVEKADRIFLATDPDREGEAISWHLSQTLNLEDKPVKRIEFNEITEPAVRSALDNPRDIDEELFESQETRKIIDRIIGYKVTTMLRRSVGTDNGNYPTGGRVQSACLKMIMDRERQIRAFVPEEFFEIEVEFDGFKAKLMDPEKPSKQWVFTQKSDAQGVLDTLGEYYIVSDIQMGERKEKPFPPFRTSSLMQAALNKYNMNSKKTMKIAQELYEGIEIGGKHVAFITYMRTDSTRVSDVFARQLNAFIQKEFGIEYLGYMHQGKAVEGAQDAHEAIRPVNLYNRPQDFKDILSKEQLQIYTLIYNQTLQSMMKDSIYETKTVTLSNVSYSYKFNATFEKCIFDGFKKVSGEKSDSYQFTGNQGDVLKPIKEPTLLDKHTEGPKRFSEATLIKEMESSGIGRPSTYASTIDTLKSRKYIQIPPKKKTIEPTQQGELVSDFLDIHFPSFINVDYTAKMEKILDDIANAQANESEVVDEFYNQFMKAYKEEIGKIGPITTGEKCPNCGSDMVYRNNRFGRFEACSNYPECKYIKKEEPKEMVEIKCPECADGHLVQRVSKYGKRPGKKFFGCSNYPNCKFVISSLKDLNK